MYFGSNNKSGYNLAFYPQEIMNYYENIELGKAKIILSHFSKYDRGKEKLITQKKGLQNLDQIVLNPG